MNNLVSQMERDNTVLITEYMVPQKDFELRKRLHMIILKHNPISTVQDKTYRNFTGFKHKRSITHIRNVIFKMTELIEDMIITELKTTTYRAITHD